MQFPVFKQAESGTNHIPTLFVFYINLDRKLFYHRSTVYSQAYLSIIAGDQLSHRKVNLFILSAYIDAYHTKVQLTQDWLCASFVDTVDRKTYLIKPQGKIRTCRKRDRFRLAQTRMTNYDTP